MLNLRTKEERMLSTSWMAETMIGANEGSKLEPLSFCSSIWDQDIRSGRPYLKHSDKV